VQSAGCDDALGGFPVALSQRRRAVVGQHVGASGGVRQQSRFGVLVMISDHQAPRQKHDARQRQEAGYRQLDGERQVTKETVHERGRSASAQQETGDPEISASVV
jgi:hypothetical protein